MATDIMEGRDKIEAIQLQGLRGLIGELRASNDFYRSRLEEAGLNEELDSLEAFVEAMPFTTKADLVRDRELHAPFGSNLTYPLERYTRYCQSSGTSGGPLPSIDTPESWSALLDCWDRVYDEAGVGCGEVVFFAFSFGPFLGFWTAFDGATRRGCLCIPGGGLSSVARLEVMRAQQATVLCCTPTYALRLGEVMREELGVSPDEFQIKNIIVAGEAGGSMPEIRDRIAAAWGGARVWDHHGMTEVGPVTYEARGEPLSLSVLEEAYLAEVIDPDSLREVGEGETGELILTTLRRTACPLLRYRTGDLVRKAYGGEEGNRSLVLRGGILGRLDEMVVVRGVNVYPTAMEQVIRGFDEVAEFQVRQFTVDSMSELKVIIEPIESVAEVKILAENVERALNNAFALRIPVELAGSGGLPRFEFKANRWIKK